PRRGVKMVEMNDDTGIAGYRGAGRLHPFEKGDERARVAALRSVEVRRAKRAILRAETEEAATYIGRLGATYQGEDLGPAARAAALSVIARVERGEMHPRDPAEWIRALADIARLEEGQPTSATVVAHLSGEALAEKLRELQRVAGWDA